MYCKLLLYNSFSTRMYCTLLYLNCIWILNTLKQESKVFDMPCTIKPEGYLKKTYCLGGGVIDCFQVPQAGETSRNQNETPPLKCWSRIRIMHSHALMHTNREEKERAESGETGRLTVHYEMALMIWPTWDQIGLYESLK